jgi:MOSC domain-containing protein YiiM
MRLPEAMVKSARAGWYYRVLEAGQLGAGDKVELVARPQPWFPLSRLITITNHGEATSAEIIALAAMPEVALGLRRLAEGGLRVAR